MIDSTPPRPRFPGVLIGPAVFVVLYSLAAAAYCLSIGNTEFLFYVGVMVVIGAAVSVVHWRVRLSAACLWAMAIWGLSHMCGGLVRVGPDGDVLYNYWLVGSSYGRGIKYDNLAHAYGFGVATWLSWQCLRVRLADQRPGFGPLLLCVLAGEGLGAVNEIIEFTATQLMPKTNVGDYANNAWDLVFNILGCIIAAALIRVFTDRSRRLGDA